MKDKDYIGNGPDRISIDTLKKAVVSEFGRYDIVYFLYELVERLANDLGYNLVKKTEYDESLE